MKAMIYPQYNKQGEKKESNSGYYGQLAYDNTTEKLYLFGKFNMILENARLLKITVDGMLFAGKEKIVGGNIKNIYQYQEYWIKVMEK